MTRFRTPRPREFDAVLAWSAARLGRSLQDLIGFLSEIHAAGVDLYLHVQGLDTSTPSGKAMFQMLGVFAEFERSLIRERVMSGLARARKQGTKSGRPSGRPRIDPATEIAIRAALAKGDRGMRKIAADLGVGTVQRVAAELKAA
jgi:DNA invertase Pin-like site-specific DNA recombinase